MKVVNPRSALLSEYEVLTFLREASAEEHNRPKSDRHQDSNALQNLRTVHFEVISELSKPHRPAAHQSASEITSFLDSLQHYGFTVKDSTKSQAHSKINQMNGHVEQQPQPQTNGELEQDPMAGLDIPPLTDEEGNEIFLEEVEIRNRLTKLEKWMLVNLVPKSEAELYAIIEQPNDRFTEAHISVLMTLLQYHFAKYFSGSSAEEINGEQSENVDGGEDVQMTEGEVQEQEVEAEAEDLDGEEMEAEVEEQEFDDEVRGGEAAVDDEEVAND